MTEAKYILHTFVTSLLNTLVSVDVAAATAGSIFLAQNPKLVLFFL